MLCPLKEEEPAIVLEFKVHDEEEEKTLKDTVAAALAQIEEMKNVPLNDEDAETLEQLWNRCQEIIRKYS